MEGRIQKLYLAGTRAASWTHFYGSKI